ncbi:MAG: hypothetical protein HQL66_00715 [Magnetococcales bacterium]|nr:hypothetical protein [Magnetococcales bacterium]
MADDLLALEALLIDRIRTLLPTMQHVMGAKDLGGVKEETVPAPAILIVFQGARIEDTAESAVSIRQTWALYVVAAGVKDLRGGSDKRQTAGPIIQALIAGLHYWMPGQGYAPLRLEAIHAPYYTESGKGFFPIVFTTSIAVIGVDSF